MSYRLTYHRKVLREDIKRLNGSWKGRIKSVLENKLTSDPLLYGKALHKTLHGYYKLRIGDYRVVYKILDTEVYIIGIRHRSKAYDEKLLERL